MSSEPSTIVQSSSHNQVEISRTTNLQPEPRAKFKPSKDPTIELNELPQEQMSVPGEDYKGAHQLPDHS